MQLKRYKMVVREGQQFCFAKDANGERCFSDLNEYFDFLSTYMEKHRSGLAITVNLDDPSEVGDTILVNYDDPNYIEKICSKLTTIFSIQSKYPYFLEFGMIFLFNRVNTSHGQLYYTNEVMENRKKVWNIIKPISITSSRVPEITRSFMRDLFNMFWLADNHNIYSKTIFENYSDAQLADFNSRKEDIKFQAIQNKINNVEDEDAMDIDDLNKLLLLTNNMFY